MRACRVKGCTRRHGDDQVCCSRHWHMVPEEVRNNIWRLYRTDPYSPEHLAAIRSALASFDNLDTR